jgi:hypothetical protein
MEFRDIENVRAGFHDEMYDYIHFLERKIGKLNDKIQKTRETVISAQNTDRSLPI